MARLVHLVWVLALAQRGVAGALRHHHSSSEVNKHHHRRTRPGLYSHQQRPCGVARLHADSRGSTPRSPPRHSHGTLQPPTRVDSLIKNTCINSVATTRPPSCPPLLMASLMPSLGGAARTTTPTSARSTIESTGSDRKNCQLTSFGRWRCVVAMHAWWYTWCEIRAPTVIKTWNVDPQPLHYFNCNNTMQLPTLRSKLPFTAFWCEGHTRARRCKSHPLQQDVQRCHRPLLAPVHAGAQHS